MVVFPQLEMHAKQEALEALIICEWQFLHQVFNEDRKPFQKYALLHTESVMGSVSIPVILWIWSWKDDKGSLLKAHDSGSVTLCTPRCPRYRTPVVSLYKIINDLLFYKLSSSKQLRNVDEEEVLFFRTVLASVSVAFSSVTYPE